MKLLRWVLSLGLALMFLSASLAQEKMNMLGGVQGSFLRLQQRIESEAVSLAQSIPQKKYTWRPMEGVRSISEAFLHLAMGNYLTMQTIGATLPEGIDLKTYQTSTSDKAKVVEMLKASFAFVDDQVGKIADSDLDREVGFFGNKLTVRDMILGAGNHEHEVMGQTIAYARMNHIVPPWTAEQEAKAKKSKSRM